MLTTYNLLKWKEKNLMKCPLLRSIYANVIYQLWRFGFFFFFIFVEYHLHRTLVSKTTTFLLFRSLCWFLNYIRLSCGHSDAILCFRRFIDSFFSCWIGSGCTFTMCWFSSETIHSVWVLRFSMQQKPNIDKRKSSQLNCARTLT